MPVVSVLIFFLILGLLVYVHELGHFLAAKMVGVRVEEFAFGFGPRLVTLMRRNGTDYTIHAVPLGGFVNLVGMQPEEEGIADGLMSKSRPARAFVFLAGPLMNIVLAILVFCSMGMITGAPRESSNQIEEVFPKTEAARAGLKPGDRILAIDGRLVEDGRKLQEVIGSSAGRPLTLEIDRDGRRMQIAATPQPDVREENGATRTVGRLGVSFRTGLNYSNEVLVVPEDSAAARAGLKVGDRIVEAEGKPIRSGDQMLTAISSHGGKPLDLVVLRDGKRVAVRAVPEPQVVVSGGPTVKEAIKLGLAPDQVIHAVNGRPVRSAEEVASALALSSGPARLSVDQGRKRGEVTAALTPQLVRDGLLKTEGRLGFSPGIAFERMAFRQSVQAGFGHLKMVLEGLAYIVRRNKLHENAGGPIMMYRMVKMNSQFQPGYQFELVGSLSLSLAIFNLLPIPVLDGGHLALLGVEALRRRRLDPSWHRAATAAGLVVIGILFLLLMYSDVSKWVTGKPLIQ